MDSIIKSIACNNPSTVAVEDSNIKINYQELGKYITEFTATLRELDPQSIGLFIDNSLLWIIVSLAARNANIAIVPLPAFFSKQQISHIIKDCQLDVIISDRPLTNELTQKLQNIDRCLFHDNPWYIYKTYHKTQHNLVLDNNIAIVTYTSGSTGTPKGVCLSESALLNVAQSIADSLEPIGLQRHLCLLPLSTLLENIAGVWAPFLSGSTVITLPLQKIGFNSSNKLDPKTFLSCLNKVKPDSIILLPEMLKLLVGLGISGAKLPDSLRFCAVGGAHVNRSLIKRAHSLGIPVFEGYGLSECASVVSINTPSQNKVGTCGKPLPHAGVRITSDNEIEISGSTLVRYLHDHESFADAYFPTGDLGYIDSDGYLTILGRKKNMYITSYGRQICPDWIENILTGHPHIAQATVYGEALPNNLGVIVPAHQDIKANDIERAIKELNNELPDYARVHDFIIASSPFTQANNFLTFSGQLNREDIWNHYLPFFDNGARSTTNCDILTNIV